MLPVSHENMLAGRWRIGSDVLGRGGFAQVRVGTDTATGQKVAIKIINKSRFANDQERMYAYREVEVTRSLDHPNIVKCYHTEEDADSIYMVLEFLGGGDLLTYCTDHPRMNERVACKLFRQLIAAVDYLHNHGVAHRDLKLENVMLDSRKERAVLIDFGLCGAVSDGLLLQTYCGTPGYAAPELIRRTPYDGRQSDIWSCGVILYCVITGEFPFGGSTGDVMEICSDILSKAPLMPSYASKPVQQLIVRMLTKCPKARITMAAVKDHPWMASKSLKDKLFARR